MRLSFDVVIIGAGIAGLAAGEALASRGRGRVLLLEKEPMPATGSTGRSAGGIRQQFGDAAKVRAARFGYEAYQGFKERFGVDPCFMKHGYLLLRTGAEGALALEKEVALQNQLGLDTQLLDAGQVAGMIPELFTGDIAAASFNGTDGYLDPHAVVQGFQAGFRRAGGEIRCSERVEGLIIEKGCVKGVAVDGVKIHAGLTVAAAGPQSERFLAPAGIRLPLKTCRRQIFSTGPAKGLRTDWPLIIDIDAPFYFRPEGDGVIMSLAEVEEMAPPDEGNEIPLARDHLDELARSASHRCPLLEEVRITSGWAGLRTITPDERPVLGPVNGLEGLLVAAGFSGHGITMAPFIGEFIAREAEGCPLENDLREPFLASRFKGS